MVAAACVALFAPACAPEPEPPGEITVAVQADVTGFFPNPPLRNEAYSFAVNRAIYDSLLVFDDAMSLGPQLAESWDSPDARTWVLRIREGARFSDGRPVRAADAAASLDAAFRYGWANLDYLQPIDAVRARDERHLVLETRSRNLTFLTRLPWGFVLPADSVDLDPVPVMGSGPYRLESWEPGVGFVLAANEYYWGEPPEFPRVRYTVVSDAEERVARLESGAAQVADALPLEDLERLEANPELTVAVGSAHRVLYLGLRIDQPPFDDMRVREAVDLAIDRGELSRRVLAGRAPVATQLVPPSIVGHNPDIPAPRLDRERARELLAEAGLPDGFEITLEGPVNRYVNDVAIVHEVARQLAEVHIRVDVVTREKGTHFQRVFDESSRFHLLGWASETGDAGDAIEFLAHSPTEGRLGRLNTTGLRDATVDRLLREADDAGDIADRSLRLQEAMARIAELKALLPLVVQAEVVAHSTAIEWDPPLSMTLHPAALRRAAEPQGP